MKKFANSCIKGPTIGPFWTNGGVGQSAQTGPILTFENLFTVQNQNSKGLSFMKKLPSHFVRAPCGGPF